MSTAAPGSRTIVVCIPAYNEWKAIALLIPRIDATLAGLGRTAEIVIVDDGSADRPPADLPPRTQAVRRITVLRLRRNLGHQRAIAIGLSYIQEHIPREAVIVMDGDGEDPPEGIPRLLAAFERAEGRRAVLAKRGRRFEGLRFRGFYFIYKILHPLFTGHRVRAGNFSMLPSEQLDRLVGVSELWNHYAASILKARIPHEIVEVDRAPRLEGRTRMSVSELIKHGLSSMSVFSDVLGLRLLLFTFTLALLALVGLAVVVFIRIATDLAIPGWASSTAGLLVLVFLQALLMAMVFVFITLQDRKGASFLPIRDYHPFIYETVRIEPHE